MYEWLEWGVGFIINCKMVDVRMARMGCGIHNCKMMDVRMARMRCEIHNCKLFDVRMARMGWGGFIIENWWIYEWLEWGVGFIIAKWWMYEWL